MVRRSIIIWLIAGIASGALAVGVLYWTMNPGPSISQTVPPTQTTSTPQATSDGQYAINGSDPIPIPVPVTAVSKDVFDEAWAHLEDWTVKHNTRVILVPHHLVAARGIASLMSATPAPTTVYLVSPDHFSQGKTIFTTTGKSFSTFAGNSLGRPDLAAALVLDVANLSVNDQPFIKEHGVYNLIPFMVKAWPGVNVVPIIVRLDATPADRLALAQALSSRLQDDPHAMVVGTVDFSHYMPSFVANFHDILAQDVVQSLSDLDTDKVELDSPGALSVTLDVARELQLGDVTIHEHTNSNEILKALDDEGSTSHLQVSFAPGPIQSSKSTTLLFTGDEMFDRNVAIRSGADKSYPYKKIEGAEKRFFRGMDEVVANLEGPINSPRIPTTKSIDFSFSPSIAPLLKQEGITVVSQANNHSLDQGRDGSVQSKNYLAQAGVSVFGDEVRDDASSSLVIVESRGQRIALLGFNATEGPIDESQAFAGITYAKAHADKVIVFMHWGLEYHDHPNDYQIGLAHRFIDAGVDAVIGAHPHWVESVETYHGHPIAYSLGNFIFDQDFSPETMQGLVVGLAFTAQDIELHLFPVSVILSQPALKLGDDRTAALNHLASISDPSLTQQIKAGVILIPTN